MTFMHAQGGLPIPDITHIDQPHWYKEGGDLSPEEFGLQRARALEVEIDRLGEDKVAAFIAEPIQGAGGVVIPPETYWPEIQRICDEREILLIADEVICGFGRTGQWFGSQTYNIKPDLMPIAKGLSSGYLPIGGVLVSDRVAQGFIADGGEFAHGYTYSGHPGCLCCGTDQPGNSGAGEDRPTGCQPRCALFGREMGPTERSSVDWRSRSKGLVGAIELTPDKGARAPFAADAGTAGLICREHCFANGLVMRHVGDTMIISPATHHQQ